jgi:SAM-dependent MidA family methyltransferase
MKEASELYYGASKDRIGASGDFFTAPELDPIFGRAVGEFIEPLLREFKEPSILELGAGRGRMAYDILSYLRDKNLKVRYYIYEFSQPMIEEQRRVLEDFDDVVWVRELPKVRGVVLSNEFFDALPVHVIKEGKELFLSEDGREVWVDIDNPRIEEFLEVMGYRNLRIRLEVCLDCIDMLRRISESLEEGYNLLIDYGYTSEELRNFPDGTVVAYSKHRLDTDVIGNIGSKDITAHVNFSALMEFGRRFGLETVLYQNQRDFLVSIPGFIMELERLSTSTEAEDIERLSRLKTLIISMGERFRVLLQRKPQS